MITINLNRVQEFFFGQQCINLIISEASVINNKIRRIWIPAEVNNGLRVYIKVKETNVECTYYQKEVVSSFISECDPRNIDDVVEISYELFNRLGLVGSFISNGFKAISYINKYNKLNNRYNF